MSICVITRADVCGLGSGSNAAVYEAVLSGFIKNVSFMACGPAIREASKLFRGTEVCCGMHFVITEEWERMPLRPLLPAEEVPSLVDEEGFFYLDTTFGGTLPAIEDIKKEWYAQLRLLRSLGFKIAYADTHMFPELAVPGLLEEMSSWIKKEGLIDHRYYYRALPCMNDLARVTGLWEKTAARLTDGIWYYLCHPFSAEVADEKMGNAKNPEEILIQRREEDRGFASSSETLEICRRYNITPIAYTQAKVRSTHSASDWLNGGIFGGYTVWALDCRTFLIRDIFGDYLYVAEGGTRAAVIDTGMGLPGLKELIRLLTDKPLVVLNTHGHLDHIGANDQFAEVYLHPADSEVYRKHCAKEYRLPAVRSLEKELKVFANERELDKLECVDSKRKLRILTDGQEIDLGGRKLEVLHTPGHTRGSVCFYDREAGQLFSGDTVCSFGVMLNFEESTSIETFMETVRKLKEKTKGVKAIYPGHHSFPLDASYFDKYQECAKRTLAMINEDLHRMNQ